MKLQHPLTRLTYSHQADGTVMVEGKDGRSGIFDRYGNWISGERKSADGLMCRFVAAGYLPPWNRPLPAAQQNEESGS